MQTLRQPAIAPTEILPPAHSGTLLEEVTKVAELRDRGLNPFAIAENRWRPLRWVLDRIELRRVDPDVLARATSEMAKDLLRQLREETVPVLDLVPVPASQAPLLGRKQREARVFASAWIS